MPYQQRAALLPACCPTAWLDCGSGPLTPLIRTIGNCHPMQDVLLQARWFYIVALDFFVRWRSVKFDFLVRWRLVNIIMGHY